MSTVQQSHPQSRSERQEFQVIGLIGVGHFLSHFLIFVLPPLLPLMKEAYGVSYVQLGLAITLFNVVSGLTQAPVGFLVDRVGPRDLLLAGDHATEEDLKAIDKEIKGIVNASADFAKDSPEPATEELWTDIITDVAPQNA